MGKAVAVDDACGFNKYFLSLKTVFQLLVIVSIFYFPNKPLYNLYRKSMNNEKASSPGESEMKIETVL
jgi:hypothetical protein